MAKEQKRESKWAQIKKDGVAALKKTKYIETPEKMWQLACEYFTDTDENPIIKKEVIKGGPNAGTTVDIELPRPYSWAGFEAYLIRKRIILSLDDYRCNTRNSYSNYIGVMKMIERTMFANKFDGASVNTFNASIIARDLQLAEKREISITEQPLFGEDE